MIPFFVQSQTLVAFDTHSLYLFVKKKQILFFHVILLLSFFCAITSLLIHSLLFFEKKVFFVKPQSKSPPSLLSRTILLFSFLPPQKKVMYNAAANGVKQSAASAKAQQLASSIMNAPDVANRFPQSGNTIQNEDFAVGKIIPMSGIPTWHNSDGTIFNDLLGNSELYPTFAGPFLSEKRDPNRGTKGSVARKGKYSVYNSGAHVIPQGHRVMTTAHQGINKNQKLFNGRIKNYQGAMMPLVFSTATEESTYDILAALIAKDALPTPAPSNAMGCRNLLAGNSLRDPIKRVRVSRQMVRLAIAPVTGGATSEVQLAEYFKIQELETIRAYRTVFKCIGMAAETIKPGHRGAVQLTSHA